MKTIAALVMLFVPGLVWSQPVIKWWFDTNDASYGQSSAADLDGDGKLEIVFGCYRNDSSVYVLNAEDGSLLWKYNTHSPGVEGCNDAAPLICDVDGDGHPEVIVASSCNPTTFCFNGSNGSLKWQCPTRGSDSPPVIADLDGDGDFEILHGEFDGYVICIDADSGFVEWEIAVDTNSWIQTAPTITDLDQDGQLDFVVGTWNNVNTDSNKVYAFRGDNHSLMWSYHIGDFMYHGTAVADFDHDGFPELIIGAYNDTLYCINGENGTTEWKYAGHGGYIGAPATVGDIDGDGDCDVVFVSSYIVTALSGNGILKWQYSIPGYEQSFRGVVLSDINNDFYKDVLFATDGGKVYALNGANGSLIWSVDLAAHYGNANFGFDHAPLVADFNGDDSLDVFVAGGYGTYPNFQNDFGRAYMFTAGKGNGPDWFVFQHDDKRQSSLCPDTITGINSADINDAIQIFPNPSHDKVTISFVRDHAPQSISIYDIRGELKFHTKNIMAEFSLDISKWQSGIYFVMYTGDCSVPHLEKLIIL